MDTISKGNFDDFGNKSFTAEEVGRQQEFCPICGKEKSFRKVRFGIKTMVFCINCKCETKAEENRKSQEEEQQKKLRLERTFLQASLGERFKDSRFENWEVNPGTEEAFELFKKYADSFSKNTKLGICVYGVPGNGKSFLSAAVVNQIIPKGYTAIFQEVPALFEKIKSTYNQNSGFESETEIMRNLKQVDLLILDDAGAEKITDWVLEKFYQIINERYKNKKPIIITTNTKSMKELEEKLGFRAYDRILEMCVPVENKGASVRRKIAKQRLSADINFE